MNQANDIPERVPGPDCDVAVIGAGHAGIEAALAAARMGLDTVLFTVTLDGIANMPCNPSVGGTAKGHLVYEIDALGGEMGRAADAVTLQSRTLNTGKGAAVRSKRVQADRVGYHIYMKHVLETTPGLRLVQGEVTGIDTEPSETPARTRVCGLSTRLGEHWTVRSVIVATGTYLDSRIFVGNVNYPAGPDGCLPSIGLSASLAKAGVPIRRFKTGTPARIRRGSIDLDKLEVHPGEDDAVPFSSDTPYPYLDPKDALPCHIVYTNADTHRVITDNIRRSALYSGMITGVGPRYCPSIEDKIVRFADKDRHQLFVEPLGRDTEEIYLQGFSTSLPTDVQQEMVHSLNGFERAEIMRYAYAIEYDCTDPQALYPTLEFRDIEGLYGAGQFNGTSGYEEAAAQGLVAGINAALRLKGEEPLILSRNSGYIGTLIDDLVTKGTNEPYRMMTGRSEFRLLLRQDNADARLTPEGHRVGLVSDAKYVRFLNKQQSIVEEKHRLETTHLSPATVNPFLEGIGETPVSTGVSLADLLRRPGLDYEAIRPVDTDRPALDRRVIMTVETDIKYDGYIKRELAEAKRQKALEDRKLSPDIDYTQVRGLRIEAAQKLTKLKPMTLGQASRISGVSPADISVLIIWLGLH